ncbi:MAG: TetR/AcrR family transcriptional regulator [Proteobacteria bacterium]|nr:TetR/AcrR family transcriptional regulator [Pseudomonadota bacterium]
MAAAQPKASGKATGGRFKPRHLPTRDRGKRSFAKVLDAAERLIERHGIDYATTRRIAKAAGLSVGAVYEYFPNKESIALRIGEAWMQRVREAAESMHPERSGIRDLTAYIIQALAGSARLYKEPHGLLTAGSLIGAVPQLREAVRRHDERMVQIVVSALRCFQVTAPDSELYAAAHSVQTIARAVLTARLNVDAGTAERMLANLHTAIFAVVVPLVQPRVSAHAAAPPRKKN